jgi:hypothetical protein
MVDLLHDDKRTTAFCWDSIVSCRLLTGTGRIDCPGHDRKRPKAGASEIWKPRDVLGLNGQVLQPSRRCGERLAVWADSMPQTPASSTEHDSDAVVLLHEMVESDISLVHFCAELCERQDLLSSAYPAGSVFLRDLGAFAVPVATCRDDWTGRQSIGSAIGILE